MRLRSAHVLVLFCLLSACGGESQLATHGPSSGSEVPDTEVSETDAVEITPAEDPLLPPMEPLSADQLSALELELKPHVLRGRVSPVRTIDRIANVGGTVAFVVETDEGPELIVSWPFRTDERRAMLFGLGKTANVRFDAYEPAEMDEGVARGHFSVLFDVSGECSGVARRHYAWFCSAGLPACSVIQTQLEIEWAQNCSESTRTLETLSPSNAEAASDEHAFRVEIEVVDRRTLELIREGSAPEGYAISDGSSHLHVDGVTLGPRIYHFEGETI